MTGSERETERVIERKDRGARQEMDEMKQEMVMIRSGWATTDVGHLARQPYRDLAGLVPRCESVTEAWRVSNLMEARTAMTQCRTLECERDNALTLEARKSLFEVDHKDPWCRRPLQRSSRRWRSRVRGLEMPLVAIFCLQFLPFLAGPTLHSGEHGAGKLSAGGPGQVLLAAKLLSEISPLVAARS